jgi:hypothetical protein
MIFINYRRDDTRFVARAVAECLRHRFGPQQVFLDEMSISDGGEWPEILKEALDRATVFLSLVGPNWLRCWDNFGRRRLDNPNDWVRQELLIARERQIPILIRLVAGNTTHFFNEEPGLPDELKWLAKIQCKPINDNNWIDDIEALFRQLIDEYGYLDANIAPPFPTETYCLSTISFIGLNYYRVGVSSMVLIHVAKN